MAKLRNRGLKCKLNEYDNEGDQEQKHFGKIPRLLCDQRKPKFRKCKKVSGSNLPLTICDLPTEILEKIVGHINIWHHNRIRGTSKRMKEIDDIFVMHEFQKALKKEISLNPTSHASAALRVR